MNNDLLPNNSYEINGYHYETDWLGRILSAKGIIHMKERDSRLPIRDSIEDIGKGDQKEGDDRGHLIGDQFDGSNGLENMIPQDAEVNRNGFKNLEKELAREVKNGKEPDKPDNPSSGAGGWGTVDLPSEPVDTIKPDDSAKPDSGDEKTKKIIAAVEEMKIVYTSAKYSKTKKTYSLKFRKSNKAYRLDGYQIYRSTKANKGFKKIAFTSKTTWTDKKPGKKGSVKYYKVRGFRKVAGKMYYTKWSSKKKLVVT